jgi:hypothetical protein
MGRVTAVALERQSLLLVHDCDSEMTLCRIKLVDKGTMRTKMIALRRMYIDSHRRMQSSNAVLGEVTYFDSTANRATLAASAHRRLLVSHAAVFSWIWSD